MPLQAFYVNGNILAEFDADDVSQLLRTDGRAAGPHFSDISASMEYPLAQQEADGQALVVARGSHGDRNTAGDTLAVGAVIEADLQRLFDGDAIQLALPDRAAEFFDRDLNGPWLRHNASIVDGEREDEELPSSYAAAGKYQRKPDQSAAGALSRPTISRAAFSSAKPPVNATRSPTRDTVPNAASRLPRSLMKVSNVRTAMMASTETLVVSGALGTSGDFTTAAFLAILLDPDTRELYWFRTTIASAKNIRKFFGFSPIRPPGRMGEKPKKRRK